MSRIFVTGDTHRNPDTFGDFLIDHLDDEVKLNKDDYLIVCGDFGFIWTKKLEDDFWLNWINNLPWTTLFVDGNHEGFERLYSYPVEEWHGGRMHRIKDSIYHLMRGEIFDIDNKKFFCFGGARSTDRMYRILGNSWWREEEPNKDEYNIAENNLKEIDFQPDYIITHDMPYSYIKEFYGPRAMRGDKTSYMLNDFLIQCYGYKKWFCGHHHVDVAIRPDFQACYKRIYEVE